MHDTSTDVLLVRLNSVRRRIYSKVKKYNNDADNITQLLVLCT